MPVYRVLNPEEIHVGREVVAQSGMPCRRWMVPIDAAGHKEGREKLCLATCAILPEFGDDVIRLDITEVKPGGNYAAAEWTESRMGGPVWLDLREVQLMEEESEESEPESEEE